MLLLIGEYVKSWILKKATSNKNSILTDNNFLVSGKQSIKVDSGVALFRHVGLHWRKAFILERPGTKKAAAVPEPQASIPL